MKLSFPVAPLWRSHERFRRISLYRFEVIQRHYKERKKMRKQFRSSGVCFYRHKFYRVKRRLSARKKQADSSWHKNSLLFPADKLTTPLPCVLPRRGASRVWVTPHNTLAARHRFSLLHCLLKIRLNHSLRTALFSFSVFL